MRVIYETRLFGEISDLNNLRLPVGLFAASLGLMLLPPAVGWLGYQRDAIFAGEWWRLLSAHLAHGTWGHWAFNMGGLALVWLIFSGRAARRSVIPLVLVIALSTSLALLVLESRVVWYLGLSALLHGLFMTWSLEELLEGRRWAWIAVAAISVKLFYEQLAGPLPGSAEAIGLPVLVDAHLYAALAGGVWVLVDTLIGRLRRAIKKRRSR